VRKQTRIFEKFSRFTSGLGNSLGNPNGFFIQFPLMNRLAASLAGERSAHFPFCVIKRLLGIFSSAARSIIRLDYFLDKTCELGMSKMKSVFAVVSRAIFCKLPVGRFQLVIPLCFCRPVQRIERGIGAIGSFAHPVLFEKPFEDGPVHRLAHQRSRFFDLSQLAHRQPLIVAQSATLECDAPHRFNVISAQ